MTALGCYWQVTCGLIVGEPDKDMTRQWSLSGEERRDVVKFVETQGAAHAWAAYLAMLNTYNWINVEYVWL